MNFPAFKSFIPLNFLSLAISILLAGCIGAAQALESAITPSSNVATPTATNRPTRVPPTIEADPELNSNATATPTLTPTAIPQPNKPRTDYTLDATFNYETRHLNVTQAVSYLNETETPLQELILVVDSNNDSGVFFLQDISVGANQPLLDFTLTGRYLSVSLQETLAPNERVDFQLSYLIVLPAEASTLGFWRQINIGDWYPFVAAQTSNGSWILDNPGLVGEHQTYPLANYDVTFAIENAPEELVVAACASPISTEDNVYTYDHKNARNFALSLSTEYVTSSATVDGITVTSYFYPEYKLAGDAALQATVNAVSLFQDYFGPYPHKSLDVVIADFGDGLEFDGMYFLGESYYRTYGGNALGFLTMIAVHETAHQWWYGLVANNQAQDPWLDEAFAIYTEYLYYETFEPDWTDWWWKFRVDRHGAEGNVDSQITQFAHRRPYINAVYLRGALFLHDVRTEIGDDDVFTNFLHDYIANNRGEIVQAEDFWEHLAVYLEDAKIAELREQYFSN